MGRTGSVAGAAGQAPMSSLPVAAVVPEPPTGHSRADTMVSMAPAQAPAQQKCKPCRSLGGYFCCCIMGAIGLIGDLLCCCFRNWGDDCINSLECCQEAGECGRAHGSCEPCEGNV